MSKLTEEQKEQIGAEIDNQGVGYWIMEYGSFEGDDEHLRNLIKSASESMVDLREYLWEHDITF